MPIYESSKDYGTGVVLILWDGDKPSDEEFLDHARNEYGYAVRHEQLKAKALRFIGDHDLRQLLTALIDSFSTGTRYDALFPSGSPYHATTAKGMPIGNLSSQIFANIYLNDFDHWVKETLRVKHYIRYVDDMVILGESPERLREIASQISDRLAADGLVIHPKKLRLAPTAAGIPFLGYVVWPNHISAGSHMRSRYLKRLRQHESGGRDRTEALQSYRAMLRFTGTTIFRQGNLVEAA